MNLTAQQQRHENRKAFCAFGLFMTVIAFASFFPDTIPNALDVVWYRTTPIEFYGRVVDQAGMGVEGASVQSRLETYGRVKLWRHENLRSVSRFLQQGDNYRN